MITYHFWSTRQQACDVREFVSEATPVASAIQQIRSRSSLVYAFRERGKLGSGSISEQSALRRAIGFENMKKLEPTPRQTLRGCARVALESRGYSVRHVTAAGVVPGARLQVKKSGDPIRRVAVRTSMDRKVGLTRDPKTGKWRTIPSAHLVVIAVPAQNNPDCAEVFAFDPKVIIHAFDALERKALSGNPKGKVSKSPFFIALDHQLDDTNNMRSNLKRSPSGQQSRRLSRRGVQLIETLNFPIALDASLQN